MKHYYSLNEYYKQKFGKKVYKLSLSGGMTCPNRDGTIDTRGCIFCSNGGSGEFAESSCLTVSEQIKRAESRVRAKTSDNAYIAYFQPFSNTYADVPTLAMAGIVDNPVNPATGNPVINEAKPPPVHDSAADMLIDFSLRSLTTTSWSSSSSILYIYRPTMLLILPIISSAGNIPKYNFRFCK